MAGIKELKIRIKSIGSTRKITRAMQLVSAAKMRKAQSAVLQSRSYASLAWEMVEEVAKQGSFDNPMTKVYPKATKIGIILLSTNRGFVGSLNTNLAAKIKELEQKAGTETDINIPLKSHLKTGRNSTDVIMELITYGKKGQILAARLKKEIVADFPKIDKTLSVEDIYSLAQFVTQAYATGKYRRIIIVYNHFISTIQQKSATRQILPFSEEIREELLAYDKEDAAAAAKYIFEPEPSAVVDHLIPRIIESQIYQTILESDASEHSARMVMMKNATEAAGDLIADLTLTFNQLRQNKITTELAEITAGKIALE